MKDIVLRLFNHMLLVNEKFLSILGSCLDCTSHNGIYILDFTDAWT